MPDFIKGMHSVEAEVIRLAMLLDKLGGSATAAMHYATGGSFTDTGKWWAKQNKLYETRYNEKDKELQKLANLEVGLDEKGNPLKSAKSMQGNAGLSRINVDAEKAAAAANKLAEEAKKINEELSNNIKLNGLDELDKKLEEIRIKFEKLSKNPLVDKGLLSQDRLNQESAAIKDWYDKDIQKQIDAAKNYEAQMKASNDSIIKAFYEMQHEQESIRHWRSGNQEISNSIPDMWGNTAGPNADLKTRYDDQIAMINAKMAETAVLYGKDVIEYQLALERKKLLDEKYAANKKRIETETWENVAGIAASQFGQIAGLMDKGNKEQFNAWKAFAIAEAIVAGALTYMKMMASATPPTNFILAGMSAGITAAQIGIIAGQQYQGRADGGTVNAGQTYWVGERGPELFTPGASGMITANDKIGGTVSIVQHNDFRNADPASEQRIKIAMKKTKEETMAAIYSSMQRGGQFAIASGRLK